MVEDGFAARVGHFQQARLHGGARKESNSHPSYTYRKRGRKVVATPEPKSLAARIVSCRPVIGRAVPCRCWDYASLVSCAMLLNQIWFRAGTDYAAEINLHMLASPSAVKSIGLGDRNWRSENLAFCRVIWSACAARL